MTTRPTDTSQIATTPLRATNPAPLWPLPTTAIPFGCQPYTEVLAEQLRLTNVVRQQPDKGFLLYGEHPSVYTVGRASTHASQTGELPASLGGIPVQPASRGGQWTYHGPGQLVVYPIVPIRAMGGATAMLAHVCQWVGHALSQLGVQVTAAPACCNATTPNSPSHTGVWVRQANGTLCKVASVGLALRHWVSYHGVAINLCNPLAPFYAITPCGFSPHVITSVHQHGLDYYPGSLPPTMDQLIAALGLISSPNLELAP
jgi:lipoyl(octanoyl) transferase